MQHRYNTKEYSNVKKNFRTDPDANLIPVAAQFPKPKKTIPNCGQFLNNFLLTLEAIWEQLSRQLGNNCWVSGAKCFFVKLTDTEQPRTANIQNQQACSTTILSIARDDQSDLRLHCCRLSVDSSAM